MRIPTAKIASIKNTKNSIKFSKNIAFSLNEALLLLNKSSC